MFSSSSALSCVQSVLFVACHSILSLLYPLHPRCKTGWVARALYFFALTACGILFSTSCGYWLKAALFFHFVRYFRTLVNCISFSTYYADPPANTSALTSSQVTAVIPTIFRDPSQLRETIESILSNCITRIVVVIPLDMGFTVADIQAFCDKNSLNSVRITSTLTKGKRKQMVQAMKLVETPFVAFVDDDVIWGPSMLPVLLAPFQNPKVGATGPQQRTVRKNPPNIWNILGIAYLERRNFNTGATNHIDGGISTLSGRTSLYRTSIVQDGDLQYAIQNEFYNGELVTSGDDKFLTEWLCNHGWKIKLQFCEEAVLQTTQHEGWAYINQCNRWAQSHWMGNMKVLATQTWPYYPQIWTFYATYLGSFMHCSLITDPILVYLFHQAMVEMGTLSYRAWMVSYLVLILGQKQIKMVPHFQRHPSDLKYVPALLLASYCHTAINLRAWWYRNDSNWGRSTARPIG